MWKDFGVKCVNWSTFCILDEYPRAGVDALMGVYFLTLTTCGTHTTVSRRKYTPVIGYTSIPPRVRKYVDTTNTSAPTIPSMFG